VRALPFFPEVGPIKNPPLWSGFPFCTNGSAFRVRLPVSFGSLKNFEPLLKPRMVPRFSRRRAGPTIVVPLTPQFWPPLCFHFPLLYEILKHDLSPFVFLFFTSNLCDLPQLWSRPYSFSFPQDVLFLRPLEIAAEYGTRVHFSRF